MGGDPFTEAQESFRRIHTGAISSSSTSTSTAIPVPGSAPAIRPAGPAPWARWGGGIRQSRRMRVKGVSEPARREDGRRFLVDRLWPRGIKRERLSLDAWAKEVAPSDTLRRWFAHDPYRWDEFRRRYAAELDRRPEAWGPILEAARTGAGALVYSDPQSRPQNGGALKGYLEMKLKKAS